MHSDIKPIQPKDITTIATVYVTTYKQIYNNEAWTQKTAYDMLSYWYQHFPDLAFKAVVNKQIVGAFLAGIKPWWDGYHLIDGELFVLPSYQKKGIGTQLLKHMFTFAQEKYQALTWDMYTYNCSPFPLQWYKDIGFEISKDWTLLSADIACVLKHISLKK